MDKKSDGKNTDVATIPFAAYSMSEYRWHKRMIALIVTIALIIAAFLTVYVINENRWKKLLSDNDEAWRKLFSEYDYSSSEILVDGKDGNANYIGDNNDGVRIYNGEDYSEDTNTP